jgi:hypothetical protein
MTESEREQCNQVIAKVIEMMPQYPCTSWAFSEGYSGEVEFRITFETMPSILEAEVIE